MPRVGGSSAARTEDTGRLPKTRPSCGMERAPETDIGMSRFDPVIRSPRREFTTRANLRRSVPGEIGKIFGKLAACAYIPSI